ncbi:hypothetical protein CC2G_010849 [Coprinopsis cinerea AmutBmut pab1-1]|nr:hypothetical protein CC2G_010849 [Coprinopsis cinerea AmutBmut pab1-1]
MVLRQQRKMWQILMLAQYGYGTAKPFALVLPCRRTSDSNRLRAAKLEHFENVWKGQDINGNTGQTRPVGEELDGFNIAVIAFGDLCARLVRRAEQPTGTAQPRENHGHEATGDGVIRGIRKSNGSQVPRRPVYDATTY